MTYSKSLICSDIDIIYVLNGAFTVNCCAYVIHIYMAYCVAANLLIAYKRLLLLRNRYFSTLKYLCRCHTVCSYTDYTFLFSRDFIAARNMPWRGVFPLVCMSVHPACSCIVSKLLNQSPTVNAGWYL